MRVLRQASASYAALPRQQGVSNSLQLLSPFLSEPKKLLSDGQCLINSTKKASWAKSHHLQQKMQHRTWLCVFAGWPKCVDSCKILSATVLLIGLMSAEAYSDGKTLLFVHRLNCHLARLCYRTYDTFKMRYSKWVLSPSVWYKRFILCALRDLQDVFVYTGTSKNGTAFGLQMSQAGFSAHNVEVSCTYTITLSHPVYHHTEQHIVSILMTS